MIVIVLAYEIDLEDMIPEIEAEAAVVKTQVTDSTARARQGDSDVEIDIHNGLMNIHAPHHLYVTCPLQDVKACNRALNKANKN